MGCTHTCDSSWGEVPKRRDLPIYRGDTLNLEFLMIERGAPVNLTGRTYAAQIRSSHAATTAVDFTVAVDAGAGKVTLSLTDAQTKNDVPTRGVWDLQETIVATGEVTTLLWGETNARDDVTA